jgi:hypothetical protein
MENIIIGGRRISLAKSVLLSSSSTFQSLIFVSDVRAKQVIQVQPEILVLLELRYILGLQHNKRQCLFH